MKFRLLLVLLFSIASFGLAAQSNHPIATAFISPNPVEEKAELSFSEPVYEGLTIVVKDLTGKTMFTAYHEHTGEGCLSVPLSVETLRKGIYILQVTGSNGRVKTLKFQKN